jgi:lysophospholipase
MIDPAPFFSDVASAPDGAEAYWIRTSDNKRLRAVVWQGGNRGTAVIFPGRTEYAEKYGIVVAKLVSRGMSVVVVDWRGQGLSDRRQISPHLGHVDDFREYQRDVAAVIDILAELNLPGPRYMIAHSMGGCIGLRTLLERSDFCGAIMSAPMWHLQMRAATRELTEKMTKLANILGLGGRLTPGASAEPTALAVDFERNPLTSSVVMYDWIISQINTHPELSLGGPSIQWTYAALEEMARLYVAPLPGIPVLTFMGSEEVIVSRSVIENQIQKMRQGDLIVCQGARHEVLMENPEIQNRVWSRIDRFFEEVPPQRAPKVQDGFSIAADRN